MKNSILIFTTLWLMMVMYQPVYAQFKSESVPIPPSPNAAALMEYASIPVDNYTGTPRIDVPLFELKSRHISVPISLSYHASGIKVQEIASSSGLGWTLNAGGVITRVVRGKPTESYCSDYFDYQNYPFMLAGTCDSQPDIFYFNFLGRTGKFVLDKTGNVVLMPYQNLKITPAVGPLATGKWEVIDEDGYKYVFGETSTDYEYTISETMVNEQYVGPSNQERFVSSWYLSKVYDPLGNVEATFQYDGAFGDDLIYEYFAEKRMEVLVKANASGCPVARSERKTSNTKIIIEDAKYLKTITTTLGTATFSFATGRLDLSGGKSLSNIVFKDIAGNQIVTYNFNYDYFFPTNAFVDPLSSPPNPPSIFEGDEINSYRLKLTSIVMNNLKFREFIYNEGVDLPPRDRNFEDHWGYYNGYRNMYPGQSLSYSGYFSKIPLVVYNGQRFEGATKDPYFLSTQADILKEIKYPTGGSTELVYEGHNNINAGGLRIKNILDKDDDQIINQRDFAYFDQSTYGVPQYYFVAESNSTSNNLIVLWDIAGSIDISFNCLDKYLYISSGSYTSLFDLNGNNVGYGKVSVSTAGNGKEDFYYSDLAAHNGFQAHNDVPPDTYYDYKSPSFDFLIPGLDMGPQGPPFASSTTKFWERGLLLKHEIFSEANGTFFLQKRETPEYDFDQPSLLEVDGVAIMSVMQTFRTADPQVHDPIYHFGKYKMISKPIFLKKLTTEIFDQSDPGNESKKLVTSTDFSFKPISSVLDPTKEALDLLPRRIVENLPDGTKVITENKYILDYASPNGTDPSILGIKALRSYKIDNALIETIKYAQIGSTNYMLGGGLALYDQTSSPHHSSLLKLKPGIFASFTSYPWSTIDNATVFSFTQSNFKPTVTYGGFDPFKNPQLETQEDGIPCVYFWDFNNSLISAFTLNADPGSPELEHKTAFQQLPFVGVTQVTDPNGGKTYFEYDAFKRLKIVRDRDNYIVARNRYHYVTENEEFPTDFVVGGSAYVGDNVSFSIPSSSIGYGVNLYRWEFGDGTSNTGPSSVSHAYSSAGTYTVYLHISNPERNPVSITKQITILPK